MRKHVDCLYVCAMSVFKCTIKLYKIYFSRAICIFFFLVLFGGGGGGG